MSIRVIPTSMPPLVVIETEVFRDERGSVMQSYEKKTYLAEGIDWEFVQDIHSCSLQGVLRGFHYQDASAPMAKLVRCTRGAVLDVALDLRIGSPTFGQTFSVELTAENRRQLMIPPEFGHGVLTLTAEAEVQYKASNYYVRASEGTILWSDPDIGFGWPVETPILSERDRRGARLADYKKAPAFLFPASLLAAQIPSGRNGDETS